MPPSPTPNRILIASATAYPMLERALARAGFQVAVANRGDSALAAMRAAAPDEHVALVLLDVALAGSARMELCTRLAGTVPVLVMSAAPTDEEQEQALQAGAAGYLRLPAETDDLVEKIAVELTARQAWLPVGGPLDTGNLEVNYHALLAGSPDAIILFDASLGLPVDVNRNAERMFGRSGAELMHMRLADLCPAAQPDGTPSSDAVDALVARGLSGDIRIFPLTFQHSSGRQIDGELRLVVLQKNGLRLLHMRVADVTGQRIAEALRTGQNRLLEMIARGAPLPDILASLLRLIEGQAPGLVCTVLLLEEDGVTVRGGAAPSMPPEFLRAFDGLQIGPEVGSCGSAMFRREPVVVADIRHDARWNGWHALAARHGLHACWAMPIMTDRHTVLGSFAIYYRDVRLPRADDERLIGVAVHLAGIAIERTRREAELARHRNHLEDLVAARTAELRSAKERAELASTELAAALDDLRKTQEELVRRDKLAALGALVAGVAHELNTPIGNSLTIAGAMSERLGSLRAGLASGLRRSDLEQYLAEAGEADEVVVRNLRRAAALITSFRQVAVDTASSQRRQFRLDEFIAELVLPLMAATVAPRPRVVQEIAAGLAMDSYPGPLGQAVSALFENAVIHGLDGRGDGIVTLSAHALEDGMIALSVADNGAGIAEGNLSRVYDPFFTTRPGAGGSGLGLHVTHNIVTGVLGGRIAVRSTPGAGTTFTMTLPAIAPG
ncbi:ATP-binding protein [Pseudoduganella umbonata]|nr:ATP-binding protein [Pseudoduganella umbonata]MBB3221750.1 PAS domain S-box-containing protein [Pseudoduganella umbonata]